MSGTAQSLMEKLINRPTISDMPLEEVRIIMAMRSAVVAHAKGMKMMPYLVRQLEEEASAYYFYLAMESVGDSWPEPVIVHCPCCLTVSYDEQLFLDLLAAAAQGNGKHFHALISDLIPPLDRQRIYSAFSKFMLVYR